MNLSQLYEKDFYQWTVETGNLLRTNNLSHLDTEHLLEEIESMSARERQQLKNRLAVLIMHLLKWQYQPNKRTRSWEKSIAEHRRRLDERFEASPSLKGYYLQIFDKCYRNARKQAKIETRLPLAHFPEICPFTSEQVLDEEFLPE